MNNLRLLLITLITLPGLTLAQEYSVESIQRISNTNGGLTGTPIDNGDKFGVSSCVIGDVDGDGVDDVALGAFNDDDGATDAGAIYILLLNSDGTVKAQQKISSTTGGGPTLSAGDNFGVNIAELGDLNGDGVVDIAVGAGKANEVSTDDGLVYVLFLDSDGSVLEYQKIGDDIGGGPSEIGSGDSFGGALANIGDVNGDGLPELAISAIYDDDGGTNKGAVYICSMDYNGTVKSYQKISDTQGGFSGTLLSNTLFSCSLGATGDIDNDGVPDLAIGSVWDDDGGTNRGAVWIVLLNTDGTVKDEQKISDTQGSFEGTLDNSDWFGRSIVGLSDVNGDGINDIAVGTEKDDDGTTDKGAIWMLYLNSDGTVKDYNKISATDPVLSPVVLGGAGFGKSVSFFGDRNNDGKIDVIVGSHKHDSDKGEVFIVHLEGLATYPIKQYYETPEYITAAEKHSALAGEPLASELGGSDYYGVSNCKLGDVDGDGVNDMVVGAYGDDDGGTDRGAVYIQFLNADGSIKSYQKISDTQGGLTETLGNGDLFGIEVAGIGDLDDDGVPDIAVGAPKDDDGSTDRGAIYILFLNSDGTVKDEQKISDTQGNFGGTLDNGDWLGYSLTSPGDIDGDGVLDIIAGARFDDDGGTNRGALWVLFLDTNGTVQWEQKISDTDGDLSATLDNTDYFGFSVTAIGDMDGDGVPDIATGAMGDDDGGDGKGAIYVINLTDSGKVKSEQKISALTGDFTGFIEDLDYFGCGIEGGNDFNQDGVNDIIVGSYTNDNGGTDRGAVWILYMNSDGTVNYHSTLSSTSNELLTKLDNSDYYGFSVSVVDYNSQNNTAKIGVGAYLDDDGIANAGATYIVSMDMMSTYDPSSTGSSTHRSLTDLERNWSYGESYDENGKVIGASKQYVDELGRNSQSLTLNIDKNRILTTQTIYDKYGRPVLNTLPAPTGVNMVYKEKFVTDVNGNTYVYADFDGNHTLNDPDSVGSNFPNTLGDYYSDNGEDDYLATSAFPYSRMEYMADPTGRIKRSAAPGENFKMGSGHESRVFYMFTGGELDRAFGEDSSFYCQTNSSDRLESRALSNTEIVADKTISIDAEGKIAITFKSDGLTIASCVSGLNPTTADSVPEQPVKNTMLYEGTQSVDIHLPESKSTTLKLPLPEFQYGGRQTVDSLDITYKIMDLDDNSLLTSGSSYTIDGSTRYVTFTGANKHRFLRISYNYVDSLLSFFEDNDITPPDADINYTLDYSHFTANYYDLAGRLRMNISPKGFDYSVNGKHDEFSKYDYDPYGQLIAKETPDEGLIEYLYSDEGMVRFSQNAQQKVDDKFSYVRYDAYNRSIESGEYEEDGASTYEFANYYDSAGTGTDVKSIVDDVDFEFTSQTSDENYIAYDELASVDEIPSAYSYKSSYPQHNLKARVSKTWNDNNQTWYSYDYAGRPEYVVQEILDDDFSTTKDERIKTVDYTYSPLTSVLEKEIFQENDSTEKLTHQFTYNDNLQLLTAVATDYNNNKLGEAAFEYYINGQLKRKELGGELQGLDYVYTLHGQLKSINHPSLHDAYDPGQDGKTGSDNATFEPDVFGMALDYYEDDYMRTGSNITSSVNTSSSTGYNNGLIQAIRWRIKEQNEINGTDFYTESSTDEEVMYNYSYDDFYRFESATFGVFDNDTTSNAFTSQSDYKVYGTSTNEGIDYDIIGNITDLNRNGYDGTPGLLMDSLSYTYNSGTSQLATITDNSTSTYSDDFETTGSDSLTYNSLGQMTVSDADDVSSITYYPTGQVKKVTFNSSGNTAEYFYNERNIKIKSKFTDVGASTTKYNWYITDASGALKSIHEREDTGSVSLTNQIIYGGGRLGIFNLNTAKLNYEITDYLGNVRVTIQDIDTTGNNPIVEVQTWADYYPFGEVLPGRNSDPTGMFGYQGQERVSNSVNGVGGSNWYNFNLRMYNPSLGRFNTIDPYSQFNSPYLAMANNPISFVDPDGGKAVLTEAMKNRINRRLYMNKGEYSRRDWLAIKLSTNEIDSWQGMTLEGLNAALSGQYGYMGMDSYLSRLGGGFKNGEGDNHNDFDLNEYAGVVDGSHWADRTGSEAQGDFVSVVMRGASDRGLTFFEAIAELESFDAWAEDQIDNQKAINATIPKAPSAEELLSKLQNGFSGSLKTGDVIQTGFGKITVNYYDGGAEDGKAGVALDMTFTPNEGKGSDFEWLQTVVQNKNVTSNTDSYDKELKLDRLFEKFDGATIQDEPGRLYSKHGTVYWNGTVSLSKKNSSNVISTFEWGFNIHKDGSGKKFDLRQIQLKNANNIHRMNLHFYFNNINF